VIRRYERLAGVGTTARVRSIDNSTQTLTILRRQVTVDNDIQSRSLSTVRAFSPRTTRVAVARVLGPTLGQVH